jgi:hypothetical protein
MNPAFGVADRLVLLAYALFILGLGCSASCGAVATMSRRTWSRGAP